MNNRKTSKIANSGHRVKILFWCTLKIVQNFHVFNTEWEKRKISFYIYSFAMETFCFDIDRKCFIIYENGERMEKWLWNKEMSINLCFQLVYIYNLYDIPYLLFSYLDPQFMEWNKNCFERFFYRQMVTNLFWW